MDSKPTEYTPGIYLVDIPDFGLAVELLEPFCGGGTGLEWYQFEDGRDTPGGKVVDGPWTIEQIRASVNSYTKHFADPIEAAEQDLLGEALTLIRNFVQWGDTHPRKCTFSQMDKARTLLAKVKESTP